MTCGSGASMPSAEAFPISSPSAPEKSWVTPTRRLTAYGRLTTIPLRTRSTCTQHGLGRGIGRQLMSGLLAECEAGGLRQIVAIIGDSANYASIGLHKSLGFREVGVLRSVGFKFGRWVDSVLMQRDLGAGDSTPP